jgi:RNA polymerase sigma-70 factor (sigma-E family)
VCQRGRWTRQEVEAGCQPGGQVGRSGYVMTDQVGDADSFGAFMAGASPALLRFGYVLTGDRHRAEELVQGALVATLRRWRHVHADGPHAYVRRAMVNAHTSAWRKLRREMPLPDGYDPVSTIGDPTQYDDIDRLVRAMRKLPARQQAVIALRYYEDLSEAETAQVLRCAPGTVKAHASRALRTLRKDLEADRTLEGNPS